MSTDKAAPKRIPLTANFYVDEFVPPAIYNKFGQMSTRFIAPALPTIAQGVRDYFDAACTINDWIHGGPYSESGFRMPDSKTGAPLSPHRRGMAIDIRIKGIASAEVESVIIKNWDKDFKSMGVTVIELGTNGWTHLACEWTASKTLLKVPYYPTAAG